MPFPTSLSDVAEAEMYHFYAYRINGLRQAALELHFEREFRAAAIVNAMADEEERQLGAVS